MSQDNDCYFQEQKNWSKRKLAIVCSYLEGFTKILGSSTLQSCVYYVDGFAGKGIYEDGAKGSPVLAIEIAKRFHDDHKKYHLNCINVESDDNNFANLASSTLQYSNYAVNLKGTFSSNISSILSRLGTCPAFFFLDPFGVKGTDWEDMIKIINRKPPTDLWLRFDHRTVRRLSGFFDSGAKGANSKIQGLLRLYGFNRADNLYQHLQGDTPEERIDNAVILYVNRLEEEYRKVKKIGYSASFPIISLEGENKYYLVFAAGHAKAVILASETVYSVERNRPFELQAYQQKKTGQPFLFSTEPEEEEIAKFIAEELMSDLGQLCAGEELSRTEVYMKILSTYKKKWFGRFSGSQFNQALSLLETGPKPFIIKRSGARSQDNTIFSFRRN